MGKDLAKDLVQYTVDTIKNLHYLKDPKLWELC